MLVTIVAVCALVLAYVALVAGWLALRTLGRLRRALVLARGGPSSSDSVRELAARIVSLEQELTATRRSAAARTRTGERDTSAALDALRTDVSASLRRVALVRYDAFGDHGGRLSFSLALLDDDGDGIALTSIAGRAESRLYAKGVSAGEGSDELSPEETQAVRAAMRQQPGAHSPAQTAAG